MLLTVQNTGEEPLRLQLTAFAWDQSPDGLMQLSPTGDVLFFPKLLSVPAGEQRRIRVAVTVPPGQLERTYRLFLEELLPPASQRQTSSVTGARVVTRTGVPIFLAPTKPTVDGRIDTPHLANGQLSFDVRNTGKIHLLARAIRVSGVSTGGAVAFEREIPGWYILAAGKRQYVVPVPPDACRGLDSIRVEVRTAEAVYTERFTASIAGCSG
jgi:fimbrial chaperone protein